MTAYLDASVLVALLTDDALSPQADAWLRRSRSKHVISDFAGAEFASAVSRKVRTGELSEPDARDAFADFDVWLARSDERVEARNSDVAAAAGFLRRLDLSLRTPDAIHVAIAQRLGVPLATLDRRMAADAVRLGVAVADLQIAGP